MKVQVLLSIDSTPLSDEERQYIAQNSGEWTIMKETPERFLVHALTGIESISGLAAFITYYNPVILGIWKQDGVLYGIEQTVNPETQEVTRTGTATFPFNATEYNSFLPIILNQFGGWNIPEDL